MVRCKSQYFFLLCAFWWYPLSSERTKRLMVKQSKCSCLGAKELYALAEGEREESRMGGPRAAMRDEEEVEMGMR